jgi:hypothetical protein
MKAENLQIGNLVGMALWGLPSNRTAGYKLAQELTDSEQRKVWQNELLEVWCRLITNEQLEQLEEAASMLNAAGIDINSNPDNDDSSSSESDSSSSDFSSSESDSGSDSSSSESDSGSDSSSSESDSGSDSSSSDSDSGSDSSSSDSSSSESDSGSDSSSSDSSSSESDSSSSDSSSSDSSSSDSSSSAIQFANKLIDEIRNELTENHENGYSDIPGDLMGQKELIQFIQKMGFDIMSGNEAKLLNLAKSLPTIKGSGKPNIYYKNKTGVQLKETLYPKSQGTLSKTLKTINFMNGRLCLDTENSHSKFVTIIDNSGSMALFIESAGCTRLELAKALVINFYLSLSEREQRDFQLYNYNDALFPLEIAALNTLNACGGTNVSVVNEIVSKSTKERFLIITDGEIGHSWLLPDKKVAILTLEPTNFNDRRICYWHNDMNSADITRMKNQFKSILK